MHSIMKQDTQPRKTLRLKVILIMAALGAVMVASVMWATSARADTQDDEFLYLLAHQGITNNGGSSAEIASAHQFCAMRAQGVLEDYIIEQVYAQSSLTHYNSVYLVGAAESVYCPAYWSGTQRPTQQRRGLDA
jgi:hypothetical protein